MLLIGINAGLIYMHYSQSAGATGAADKPGAFRQEIEVVHRQDALYIKHHFYGLDTNRYEIIWPAASVEQRCLEEEQSSCSRLHESGVAFEEGEAASQSLFYKIPIQEPLVGRKLFEAPFVQLQNASTLTTLLHFTDETDRGGMWLNGMERVGMVEKERIHYKLFRGIGFANELYWQATELPLTFTTNQLSVYGNGLQEDEANELDHALKAIGADHVSLVLTSEHRPLHAQRLIVEDQGQAGNAKNYVLQSGLRSRFAMPSNEPSLANVTASILSGEPIGTKAEQQVFMRLKETLSEAHFEEFSKALRQKFHQQLSAKVLDDMILEVTGWSTSYFTNTIHEQRLSSPFLFEDPRPVVVNGNELMKKVILRDGNSFYSASSVLKTLGYSIRQNEQSIYIEKEGRNYRFSKIEPFYVLNDRKYDYTAIPYATINGELYFDENWLRRLFLVVIEKENESIVITPIEQMMKELEGE